MSFSFKSWGAETLTSSDLNSEFAKIESKFGSITNGDLSDQAQITSTKLRDRYAPSYQTVVLNGDTWGGNFTFQDSATQGSVTEAKIYPEFPGKRAYLVSVSVRVDGYSAGAGGEDAQVWVTHNGTVINSLTFTADAVQYIRSNSGATAFSSPIVALSTGDYIGLQFGRDATGNSVTATAVTVTLSYKVEITA